MKEDILQQAFVLHRRPYLNTSLLVDVFTEKAGRFTVVARGVKRPKSLWRGLLQPFIPLLISWRGKHELKNLVSAEMHGHLFSLKGLGVWCGFYMNELLMRVVHAHDPCETIFLLYRNTLHQLIVAHESQDVILRLFEQRLLSALGYELHLQSDCRTREKIMPEAMYRYIPELGVSKVASTGDERDLFCGKSLIAIVEEDFSCPQTLRDAKRLFRLALAPLLGNKPLQTPQMAVK